MYSFNLYRATLTDEALTLNLFQKNMAAASDLSPAFISGIVQHFPDAEITFDRFHVIKLLNEAMDTVRKQERKEHDALKGHKYTFLKNNLSDKKQCEF